MLNKLFRKKENHVNLSINVEETDFSERKPQFPGNFAIGLNTEKGPINQTIYIGPTIDKPKWYQFWRWHLISRYKKECKEAEKKFLEVFGRPQKNNIKGDE